ncbi:FMN-dependent NADH-azoreductase [Saccharopolyspora sp. MS10]|uniref:FMN-dependent NADH-azoreductase n=1 Tax=Saccharopolyspora sp. MS10 TaxID=3385973 RepID=UPI0039A117F8
MNLLRLDASILPTTSSSAQLADLAEAEWHAAHPTSTITRRHLATDPLPAEAWALAATAGFTPEAERTAEQADALRLAADLAAELQHADAVLLAVPLYNFGVSQHVKTWIDLIIAGAGPTNPVLAETPTALITTLGGGYGPGTPREGWDHATPYLRRILGEMWQAELTVITRELTRAASDPAMEGLRDLADQQHANAQAAARAAGKVLAGR